MAIKQLTPISLEEELELKKKSLLNMPVNPSAKGVSAESVRNALTNPYIGNNVSLLEFIKRMIDEQNDINSELVELGNGGTVVVNGGGDKTHIGSTTPEEEYKFWWDLHQATIKDITDSSYVNTLFENSNAKINSELEVIDLTAQATLVSNAQTPTVEEVVEVIDLTKTEN